MVVVIDDEEKHSDCEYCGGTGYIEKTTTYRDDPNAPLVTEGTGIEERCFNCNQPDDDAYDQADDR